MSHYIVDKTTTDWPDYDPKEHTRVAILNLTPSDTLILEALVEWTHPTDLPYTILGHRAGYPLAFEILYVTSDYRIEDLYDPDLA